MPLIAWNKVTSQRVNIFSYENPKLELKKSELACPLCKQPFFIKGGIGTSVRAHFSHYADCSNDYERHAESPEHLYFKDLLARNLAEEFSLYIDAAPHLEYPIPEVKRVADVVFEFPNGWLEAHEVQFSPITPGELEQRTHDYWNAGVDIVWWLGKSADTKANRDWVNQTFGQCFTIDWKEVNQIVTQIGDKDEVQEVVG